MKTTTSKTAFSLLEIILALAVAAILAAALLVPFVKHLDRLAGEKEVAMLRTLSQGFKDRILATKSVPNAASWAQEVATQLGLQVTSVSTNERRQPRVFLIDPDMQIGVNGAALPYAQPITGSTVTNGSGAVVGIINPRFMLISSVSGALPGGVVSGVGATSGVNAFTNIWATPEGTILSGWPDDVKTERIDLSGLFVQVFLNNRDSVVPAYAVDSLGTNTVAVGGTPTMYFLRTTDLRLLNSATPRVTEYSELLQSSAAFNYDVGSWNINPYIGRGVGTLGPMDMQKAMDLFLTRANNPHAQAGAIKTDIYNTMVAYMSNFVVWRAAG